MILNKSLIVVYTDNSRPIVIQVATEDNRDLVQHLHSNASVQEFEEFVAEYGFAAGEDNQYRKQSLRGELENFGELLTDLEPEGGIHG